MGNAVIRMQAYETSMRVWMTLLFYLAMIRYSQERICCIMSRVFSTAPEDG